MTVQNFTLPAGTRSATSLAWTGLSLALDAALTEDGSASITGIELTATTLSLTTSGGDLSEQVELGGTVFLWVPSTSDQIEIWPAGDDEAAPYVWTLSESEATAAAAFLSTVDALADDTQINLRINDHTLVLPTENYVHLGLNIPDEPQFDQAYWTVAPGGSLGRIPAVWMESGGGGTTRNLTHFAVQSHGWIELVTSGAVFRSDLREEIELHLNVSWPDRDLSLIISGIGDSTNPYAWIAENADEVDAFYRRTRSDAPTRATLQFRLPAAVHPSPSAVAVGQSAVAARSRIVPTAAHDSRSGVSVGSSATIAGSTVLEAISLNRAGLASSQSAVGLNSLLRHHPVAAGTASSPSSVGVREMFEITPAIAGVSVSQSAVAVRNIVLEPIVKSMSAGVTGAPSAIGSAPIKRTPTVPLAPRNLEVSSVEQTSVVISWDPPLGDGNSDLEPVLRYDIQFFGEGWQSVGSTRTEYLLSSIGSTSIKAGTFYRVRVRAINSVGNGEPSDIFLFESGAVLLPSAPRFASAIGISGSAIEGAWQPPADLGGGSVVHYEVALSLPDGTINPFEPTDDESLTWRVRGLADGQRYGMLVRAVNQAGAGPASEMTSAIAREPVVLPVASGQRLPLLPDPARQSMIVRLQDIDCRIIVWWQPWDDAWYGAFEAPVNSLIVASRRLAVNSGLLDRAVSPLTVNVVCRALDAADDRVEPGRNAWREPSHGLFIT